MQNEKPSRHNGRVGGLKILMVTDLFYPVDGGVPNVIWELSRRLVKCGHNVSVVTYKFEPDWKDYESIDGVKIFRVSLKWSKLTPFYFSAPVNMRRVISKAWEKEKEFDLVHSHLSLAGFGALMLSNVRLTPKIFSFYGDWAKEYLAEASGLKKRFGINRLEANLMRLMQKRCLLSADEIVVLSKYSKRQVSNLLPLLNENKLKIIHGGVDLGRYRVQDTSYREKYKDKLGFKGRFMILTIRRLFRRMGLFNLIEAMDLVKTEYPEVFLIIGGKGYLKENLEFRIKNLGLKEYVRLEGFIPEEKKADYLAAADLYVLPTMSLEGFGLTTLEALACGTPVLGTPTGATPELLGNFQSDLLLAGTSPRGIADGIIKFIKKYRNDEELRRKCRKYAEGFSWERMVGRYEKLYRNVKA